MSFAVGSASPFFVSRAPHELYEVTVDATDTISMLDAVAAAEDTELDERLDAQAAAGLHPMGSFIEIELRAVGGHQPVQPPFQLLGRFLQQLFLGLNLAVPGSCNLFLCRYENFPTADPGPPNLTSDILETAYSCARETGWPPLQPLTFRETWSWLHAAMLYDVDIARGAADKALFTLLRICAANTVDTDNILLIAQAFESFFTEGRDNIGSILRKRLAAVLGEPASHKKWFSQFYELRSRIAHGDVPLLRPGGFYDVGQNQEVEKYIAEFFKPVDEAVGVLLSVMQDLILSGSRGYRFEQHVVRVP